MLSVEEEGIPEAIVDRMSHAVVGEEAVLDGLLVPFSFDIEKFFRNVLAFHAS